MTKEMDDLAIAQQRQTIIEIIEEGCRGYPKPRPSPVPDETLDFTTGKVKPRPKF